MSDSIEKCYDCDKPIELEGEEIKNGVLLKYRVNDEDIYIFKCQECYDKSPELKNYQDCEVYSRIVGYLRPIQQWGEGKKEEFKERKNYKI